MEAHDLERRFTYHAPIEGQPEKYIEVRSAAKALACLLDELVPNGREKSLAITKLEEVVFWSNAGIAREETT